MDVPARPMHRVNIVGSTGSGKTSLGRELASILGVPHVELDALNWGPRWTAASPQDLLRRVAAAVAGDGWVVDGNYGAARDLVWQRADTLIWLDYPLRVILARLFRRTNARIRAGAELWPGTGNVESFRSQYLSRDSLFVWLLKTYRRRRRELPALLALPQHAHLRVLRFTTPTDADRWLAAQRSAARGSRQDAWPR